MTDALLDRMRAWADNGSDPDAQTQDTGSARTLPEADLQLFSRLAQRLQRETGRRSPLPSSVIPPI